jgi:hypothetical protein
VGAKELGDQVQPQPNGIDVPGGDLHQDSQASHAVGEPELTRKNPLYSNCLKVCIAAMRIHKL